MPIRAPRTATQNTIGGRAAAAPNGSGAAQRIQQSHSVTGLAASGQFLVAASGQISMTVNTQRSPGRQQPWRVRREITVPQGDTHARRRMAMRGAERVCGPDRVPSMIFPRAGRPAGGPPDNGRNRGDKRFGGPLIRPGRCPLYRSWPSVDDQLGITPRASPDSSGYIFAAQPQRFCSSCPLFKRHADVTWGYMSVHSRKQADSDGHSGTSSGQKQQPARPGKPSSRAISAGGGRCWVRTNVG